MAVKKPLCLYDNVPTELRSGDSLPPGRREITYSISGDLATGAGKLRRYIQNNDFIVSKIIASVGAAPAGSAITFDIKKNGVVHSILSADGAIAAGSNTATITSFSDATIEIGSYLTVDVNAVGGSTTGSDLTITLYE